MGPPLAAGPEFDHISFQKRSFIADIVADVDLTVDERDGIANWLAGVEKENRGHEFKLFEPYVIHPHMDWVTAPETQRRIRRRFSCSGFVFEAYAAGNIRLVDVEGALPSVSENEVASAYPVFLQLELKPEAIRQRLGFGGREQLGLTSKGPWKLLLPGYLFHATARASSDDPRPFPYTPTSSAETRFPLRPGTIAGDPPSASVS